MLEAKQSKEKAKELLDELPRLGPSELAWWNIKTQTFLVFAAIGNMNEQSRQERMDYDGTLCKCQKSRQGNHAGS